MNHARGVHQPKVMEICPLCEGGYWAGAGMARHRKRCDAALIHPGVRTREDLLAHLLSATQGHGMEWNPVLSVVERWSLQGLRDMHSKLHDLSGS